jgi:hypothetical protein
MPAGKMKIKKKRFPGMMPFLGMPISPLLFFRVLFICPAKHLRNSEKRKHSEKTDSLPAFRKILHGKGLPPLPAQT